MRVCDFTFYIAQVVFESEYGWVHDAMDDMKVRYSLIEGLLRYDSPYVYVMNVVIHLYMIVDYYGI